MFSVPLLVHPQNEQQTVTIRQRDVVGSMRVYVVEKQEEVAISSLHNKRLFLRHPSGNGVWLDNSTVFSSYAINPTKDVLELRPTGGSIPTSLSHRSCLKLIVPYYDYHAVFSDFLENPQTITVEAIKKALTALTLFNISPSDETQLWYLWPIDHSLNQIPNTRAAVYPNFRMIHAQHNQQSRARSSSHPHPIYQLSVPQAITPTSTFIKAHPLASTPPQPNFFISSYHSDKDKSREHKKEADRQLSEAELEIEQCEECKQEQEKYLNSLREKGNEVLRRVLCTPHTQLEFCVMWSPRVALLKSIKRRIVVLIHSLSVYKTLIFQHRTTVQDALQILTEFVHPTNRPSGDIDLTPTSLTQKRFALFKDGARLEEDMLLAELLDPQVLWNRVVCVFMEVGVIHKITSPLKSLSLVDDSSTANSSTTTPSASSPEETPDSEDCHLLVLYRKQQAFRNFHLNPALPVGRAIKIITDSFSIPSSTTINQDDWSYRLQRHSSGTLKASGEEGSGSSGSTPNSSSLNNSSGNNTPGDTANNTIPSSSPIPTTNIISTSPIATNGGANTEISEGTHTPPTTPTPLQQGTDSVPTTPASPYGPSPKPPSFPFSLFSATKNAFMLELAPVASPSLSLANAATGSSAPTSGNESSLSQMVSTSAPPMTPMTPPLSMGRAKSSLSASTMGGDLDNRHEYMLYDFHKHEWLDNDRTLASYKFHTKYTNFSDRLAPNRSMPHIGLSESIPIELQLRPRPRMRRMALIDGVDFSIPLETNANAILVYSPTTTVAAAIDEVQTLNGTREPSLELFVRYNLSAASPSSSPTLSPNSNTSPTSPLFNGRFSPYYSGNGASAASGDKSGILIGSGSYNKLFVERVCLEFGKTLWSYNFLPTSTLEIFVEDEERRDTEVLEEQALKAFGSHATVFLPGEFTQHSRDHVTHFEERVGGECASGRLIITNYRLIFHSQNRSSYKELAYSDDIDIPLCTIDKVKPIQFSGGTQTTTGIDLTCKDMRNIMFGWRSDGGKNLASILKKLMPTRQEDFFAFASKETFATGTGWDIYDAEVEYKRLGLASLQNFRLTRVNKDYSLCSTYPAVFVVPAGITDDMLTRVASFREKGRVPAVTWVHPNGASITRCSQPRVGIGRARCVEDEMLLKALSQGSKTLYLIDSRPMANAMYNTLAGRGFETAELYPNCKLIFLGIGNIHVMRESFKKLVDLCLSRSTDDEGTHWLSALESTNWMEHARVILKSAAMIVDLVDKKNCSVVTHCSDGWDRTSQIVALSEVLLDPFYRSIRGFEILLEKEWLSFGHMFGARSGNWLEAGATKENEFAPIFLLFLDAVYKVMMQFPTSFEFNENFLLTVADSVYNCRFGTFLYNSERDRAEMQLKTKTTSLWACINSNKRNYTNPHYSPQSQQRVLFPSIRYPKLAFWGGYYLRYVKTHMRSTDSVDARMWQLIDENAALKAHIEKLQAGIS